MKLKLSIFIFLCPLIMMSQKKASLSFNETPLIEVVSKLENKFDIKLSFNSELITNQTITFSGEDVLLSDIFNAIEQQSGIEFVKITDRYYSLRAQTEIDLTKTQNLDEVVISEYLTSGVHKKSDASIILSPNKLGILPGLTEPDVLQSLQLLPGIQSPSETASGLYIRGGTPDQNLILWDGIKMYHSGHFFGMISAFNPYITEDIKLFTQGTKARYGNRISGVIDITSSSEVPEKTEGGIGFNLTHADLFLKTPLSNKVAFIVSARRSFTDVLNTITFKKLSNRVFQNTSISRIGNNIEEEASIDTNKDLFNFYDVTLKTIIKPSENDDITVSSLFNRNKLDYEFLIEDYEEERNDQLHILNQGFSASWKHNYSKAFSHDVKVYHSKFDLDYSGRTTYNDDNNDETIKRNDINDFGLSFEAQCQLNPKNVFYGGYQFSSNKVGYNLGYKSTFLTEMDDVETSSETNNTNTLFLEYQYKNGDAWNIDLGLRASNVSLIDRFLMEPRVHFSIRLVPNLWFKLSAEKNNQTVSQVVEFNTQDFGLENQIWVLADNDFVPLLRSHQYSFGLSFKKKGWHLDLDLYRKDINGLTSFNRGFNGINDNFSTGKSSVLGIDILLKKRIHNYRTWLSYTTMKNDFKFSDLNAGMEFPGNFHVAHQLVWSHTYKLNSFNFSLGWHFRTGTPYTRALSIDQDSGVINYDVINNERLPDYHRLDFSSTYKFNLSKNKWKGRVGLSVLNLYNKSTVLSRTYESKIEFNGDNTASTIQKLDKVSLGITPNVVFRVEF